MAKKKPKKGLRLQSRDLDVLSLIGELGLLDNVTIAARFWTDPPSPRACNNKLQNYKDHGLVQLLDAPDFNGKIFRLTPTAADELERRTGQRPKRVPKSKTTPKPATLEHRLGSIRARLRIDDACHSAGLRPPNWIMEYDMNPAARPGDPDADRFVLTETFSAPHPVSCRPDAAFRLHVFAADADFELAGYLEYDRGTEELQYLTETKLPGYAALMTATAYNRHWPDLAQLHMVRVFFICPGEGRIGQVSSAIRGRPGAEHFRFAIETEMKSPTLLTDEIWSDVDGNLGSILKPASTPSC